MKKIAFIDIETTGLDPKQHEMIEVAVVRVDGCSLDPIAEVEIRIHPCHLDRAEPKALMINGYCQEIWRDAISLSDALPHLNRILDQAIVAGHNVSFDWSFLVSAYEQQDMPLPRVDHRRIDTLSLAWPLYASREIPSLSLDTLCNYFGIKRPHPHRALVDIHCTIEVARHLLHRFTFGGRITRLPPRNQAVFLNLLDRFEAEQHSYVSCNSIEI